jgi:hypothetical protein
MVNYRTVRLAGPFRHGALAIDSLEFAVGAQLPGATLVHVRGVCDGEVPFAGCIALSEGRDVPAHDLRVFGAPRDLGELATAIDLLLAGSSPGPAEEMWCLCE